MIRTNQLVARQGRAISGQQLNAAVGAAVAKTVHHTINVTGEQQRFTQQLQRHGLARLELRNSRQRMPPLLGVAIALPLGDGWILIQPAREKRHLRHHTSAGSSCRNTPAKVRRFSRKAALKRN